MRSQINHYVKARYRSWRSSTWLPCSDDVSPLLGRLTTVKQGLRGLLKIDQRCSIIPRYSVNMHISDPLVSGVNFVPLWLEQQHSFPLENEDEDQAPTHRAPGAHLK